MAHVIDGSPGATPLNAAVPIELDATNLPTGSRTNGAHTIAFAAEATA